VLIGGNASMTFFSCFKFLADKVLLINEMKSEIIGLSNKFSFSRSFLICFSASYNTSFVRMVWKIRYSWVILFKNSMYSLNYPVLKKEVCFEKVLYSDHQDLLQIDYLCIFVNRIPK